MTVISDRDVKLNTIFCNILRHIVYCVTLASIPDFAHYPGNGPMGANTDDFVVKSTINKSESLNSFFECQFPGRNKSNILLTKAKAHEFIKQNRKCS